MKDSGEGRDKGVFEDQPGKTEWRRAVSKPESVRVLLPFTQAKDHLASLPRQLPGAQDSFSSIPSDLNQRVSRPTYRQKYKHIGQLQIQF